MNSIVMQGRRVGNTTRLINKAIEQLFEIGEIGIYCGRQISDSDFVDPASSPNNYAQEFFVRRLLNRLQAEHAGSFEYKKEENGLHTIKAINQHG